MSEGGVSEIGLAECQSIRENKNGAQGGAPRLILR
jgi:hypothetical protein